MPPPKRSTSVQFKPLESTNALINGAATRSKRLTIASSLRGGENHTVGKRKAESPLKKATKRSALGELTNVRFIFGLHYYQCPVTFPASSFIILFHFRPLESLLTKQRML